jgi:hypothetical protein
MGQSKYNTNELTRPQMLAEKICERIAKKEKRALPYRFWQMDEWKAIYQLQIMKASLLLKEYTFEEIIRALANPRAAFIYSFGAKKLWEPYLKLARKQLAAEAAKAIKPLEVDEKSVEEKPVVIRPSKSNVIMELD